MKSKRDREEPCFICNHYHDVENGEPCTVCGHVMSQAERKQLEPSVLPTAVIPGSLYLGSYDTASRSELLRAMGITHILNTWPSNAELFKNSFKYHTVTSTPVDFQECHDFLDMVLNKEQKVLVYCMTGVSRSPSVVIAYLMKKRGWRLAESYKWVKDKRQTINIKEEDVKRLQEYEVQLHGSCSAPMGLAILNNGPAFGQQPQAGPSGQQQEQSQEASAPSTSGPVFGSAGAAPAWSLSNVTAPQGFRFGTAAMPGPAGQSTQQERQQASAQGQQFGSAGPNPFAPRPAAAGDGGGNDMEM
ncbi:hypothetical protein CHLRE_03g193350v5 [Chlamydomonas reinhardtii]|uniref:Uncharacterized protein n=1 Tax=Chlamydomonas reinhardtii TaxID=3055 RepID=A8IWH5_CHLRE|nr:uncharacterized protein CHLRE_03g193350v5 [Chlamydomonas reinhardtii]PNW85577.1 hypothetical protein CHLRE_03g193350v5 [Chlamydomonas reinhardtii]|eukprot:XP_001693255.1 dual-specificity protein phosphatase 7 [Chlamydomonas reinhardtii]